MKLENLKAKNLMLAIAIPLSSGANWQLLKYNKIESNGVSYSNEGLSIQVDKSASPLIYPLPEAKVVTGFKVRLKIFGKLNESKMTAKMSEDNYLRVGLVAEGKQRLNMVQRMVAAAWVKQLFKLAPKDSGIDKIYFYGISDDPKQVGQTRIHPKSDLMVESIVALRPEGESEFEVSHKLTTPLKTAALWLAIDGDDTKSKFRVEIKSLELTE